MKIIIIALLLIINLYANIEVSQNIRALYRGVNLSEIQEDYILDNQDKNIQLIKNQLKIYTKNIQYIQEKNVIKFTLTPNGEIKNIKFLQKSDNRKIDRATIKAIKKAYKHFTKPIENTEMRFIISFYKKHNTKAIDKDSKRENYFIPISSGTTRFEYSSKEYVRVFETSKDGFINLSLTPQTCASVTVLTNKNQKVHTGYVSWSFNRSVTKGKYKLLIKTSQTCDVNFNYI